METDVSVREIVTREYVGVSEADTVAGAAELMVEEEVRGVVVLRGSDPVGSLSAQAAMEALLEDPSGETPIGEVMADPAPTIHADASLARAAGQLTDANAGRLLVDDGGAFLGVVGERDVVAAVASLPTREEPRESTPGAPGAESPVEAADAADAEYSAQSVCEICGSLTPDLRNFNGQLICGDCRDM